MTSVKSGLASEVHGPRLQFQQGHLLPVPGDTLTNLSASASSGDKVYARDARGGGNPESCDSLSQVTSGIVTGTKAHSVLQPRLRKEDWKGVPQAGAALVSILSPVGMAFYKTCHGGAPGRHSG